MSSTLEASVFMGTNYSENLHCIKNTGQNLALKQMFDISEKLITEQSDEIFGVTPIDWEDSSRKQLSVVNEEEVVSFSRAKVEWNMFPGFTSLQLINKVHEFMNNMSEPEQFKGRIIFISMFNDIIS